MVHFLISNLRQVERQHQGQDGDDNVVRIFTLNVQHQVNSVHQLSLRFKHQASMRETQSPPLLFPL